MANNGIKKIGLVTKHNTKEHLEYIKKLVAELRKFGKEVFSDTNCADFLNEIPYARKQLLRKVDAAIVLGGRGWKSAKLQEKIKNAGNRIIHIENCNSKDLPIIYRLATIFVYPSLYEGFGLPPLEAMASGCPVICSNTASLPEVCGDGAILFDPKNPQELKNAIQKVLTDEELQNNLRKKGLLQAEKFSWAKTAEETLKTFD